jgi:hypothetical protein
MIYPGSRLEKKGTEEEDSALSKKDPRGISLLLEGLLRGIEPATSTSTKPRHEYHIGT